MNPIVMKMLADARMQELRRYSELEQADGDRGFRGPWITLPLALVGLLAAAVVASTWTI